MAAEESNTGLHEKPFTTSTSLPELPLYLPSGGHKTSVAGVPPAAFNSANHSPIVSSQYDENYQGSQGVARSMGPSIGLGLDLQSDMVKVEGLVR